MRKERKDALKADLAVPKKRGRKPKVSGEKETKGEEKQKEDDELSMEGAIEKQDKELKLERAKEEEAEGTTRPRRKRQPKKPKSEEKKKPDETPMDAAPEKPAKKRRTKDQPKESDILFVFPQFCSEHNQCQEIEPPMAPVEPTEKNQPGKRKKKEDHSGNFKKWSSQRKFGLINFRLTEF